MLKTTYNVDKRLNVSCPLRLVALRMMFLSVLPVTMFFHVVGHNPHKVAGSLITLEPKKVCEGVFSIVRARGVDGVLVYI
jgi:hypothetical protein